MPGLISHFLCGGAVRDKLEENVKKSIIKHQKIFNIGTQGPDVFFYYLPFVIKKGDNIGSIMHRKNVGKFMEALIKRADSLKGEEREKAFVYVAGYLTHYNLDAYAHPYIYYRTGTSSKDKKTAIKHSVYHRRLETAIDTTLLRALRNEKPSDLRLYSIIKAEREDIKLIGELLSYAIYKAFGVKLKRNEAKRAINYMWRATMLFQSKGGKKKKLITALEQGLIGQMLASSVIHEDRVEEGIDYLNLGKNAWFLPWDNSEEKRHSFMELFFLATEDSVNMISLLFAFGKGEKSLEEVLFAVGEKSFLSGVREEEEGEFRFFNLMY